MASICLICPFHAFAFNLLCLYYMCMSYVMTAYIWIFFPTQSVNLYIGAFSSFTFIVIINIFGPVSSVLIKAETSVRQV